MFCQIHLQQECYLAIQLADMAVASVKNDPKEATPTPASWLASQCGCGFFEICFHSKANINKYLARFTYSEFISWL